MTDRLCAPYRLIIHRSLFKNCLTTVPPEIGRLTSLPRLALYENKITHLPPEMGDMAGLVEL